MSMNKYNNFTVEETNLLSIYMTASPANSASVMRPTLARVRAAKSRISPSIKGSAAFIATTSPSLLPVYHADEV